MKLLRNKWIPNSSHRYIRSLTLTSISPVVSVDGQLTPHTALPLTLHWVRQQCRCRSSSAGPCAVRQRSGSQAGILNFTLVTFGDFHWCRCTEIPVSHFHMKSWCNVWFTLIECRLLIKKGRQNSWCTHIRHCQPLPHMHTLCRLSTLLPLEMLAFQNVSCQTLRRCRWNLVQEKVPLPGAYNSPSMSDWISSHSQVWPQEMN